MMQKKLLLVLIFSGIMGICQAQTPAAAPVPTEKAVTEGQLLPAAETAPADSAPQDPAIAKDLAKAMDTTSEVGETLETVRETVAVDSAASAPKKENGKQLVVFNSKTRRDPTLSPDDFLLLEHREKQRLAAIEAERQRKLAEERRKREEEERLRQLELARIKDPAREVRGLIRIEGIVGKEVFIGDKVYTVGNKVFGARIVEVTSDSVVFSYKGHTFVKKMQ